MRLLVAGGGTGGHIFPGVAVAEEFKARAKNPRVVFVGSDYGMEKKLVPAAGFSLFLIPAGGLKRLGLIAKIRNLLKLPLGFIGALRIIISFTPDVVLGEGGYVAGAVCVAAKLFGIPVAIQEQNAVPGFTNRLLGKFAKRIFLAFPVSEEFFKPERTLLTGNPIRKSILEVEPLTAIDSTKPLTILIFGGSQGATKLNQALTDSLQHLAPLKHKLQFIHQTGEQGFNEVSAKYQEAGFRAEVFPFINDMAAAYRRAHLVIARSGASILEIAACGRPSVLIPYPYAADDHQAANAKLFESKGAALVVSNADFDGKRCADIIRDFEGKPARLIEMGQAAHALCQRDAAASIAEACIALGNANA